MAWGYDREYFVARQAGWDISAAALAPLLLCLFTVRSAVEIGCGTANLLAALARHGVAELRGLHGPHDPPDLMQIAPAALEPWDLDRLAPLGRRFDLAC